MEFSRGEESSVPCWKGLSETNSEAQRWNVGRLAVWVFSFTDNNEIIFVFSLVDQGNFCCVCHIHFDDKKKNATKKWRSWSQCTVCQSWSHTACGFKSNMCLHCQSQNTRQTLNVQLINVMKHFSVVFTVDALYFGHYFY